MADEPSKPNNGYAFDVHLVRSAATELDVANKALQNAFLTWSESVTSMHMAELTLRDAQKRLARAHELLTTALNNHAAGQ